MEVLETTKVADEEDSNSAVSVEIVTGTGGFDAIENEWSTLIEESDAHIFQTFEWQRTWWKYFGKGKELHIILFRKEGDLVGILPMFLDCFKVLGYEIYRCLRMIGSRVMQPPEGSFAAELAFSDYLSIIVSPEYEKEIQLELEKYITSHRQLFDEIILEEVPEDSTLLGSFSDRLEKAGWSERVEDASVCPLIRFPDSWDDFLMDLSSNARYQIRRHIRKVTDDEIFEIQTAESETEVQDAFNKLVDFHQIRWNKLGQPGIFLDKRVLDFFREITLRFHEKGWLFMKTAMADDQCVAVDLLFRFKGTIYMVQRGFDDRSEYRDESPGSVLLYYVIWQAIENGYHTYDFLRGEESYKLRTATHTPQNKEVTLRPYDIEGGLKPKLNNYCRQYAHFSRKLRNERDVFKVHMNSDNSAPGVRSYLGNLFRKSIKKIKD